MTQLTVSGSAVINRPSREIWDYMADPETLHNWVKGINTPGNWIDGGNPESVGSRYRIDYAYGRKINEIVFEVTATEPGSEFGVNSVKGPYPSTFHYRLTESPDGNSTTVAYVMTARSDGKFTAFMFIVTGWLAKTFMRRQMDKELVELASELESV